VDWTSLERVLHRVIERRYLRDEVISLRKRLAEIPGSGEFIGMSGSIQHVRDVVARVAPTDLVVLIEGESGTGKELIAYGIHSISLRKKRPFIPVNCAAIPPELIESEFFGHVKGGSSSVTSDSRGLFRTAEGGTLFLDEVAQLPMSIQPKLLRALEEKEVRAVGSAQAHQVDVRIIAATNQDLQAAVNAGRFRQDLFYRLSVVKIEAPPLRSIKEDISLIATHYVRRLNRRFARNVRNIAPDAMASLTGYNFPGNVRELENIIERAYALGVDDEIKLCDLPTLAPVAQSMWSEPSRRTLEAFERDLVAQTLRTHRNDKSKAAAALGMSERTLYRRMKKHGISQQSWGSHP
jgi:DNA-binding NtrC family response regulator